MNSRVPTRREGRLIHAKRAWHFPLLDDCLQSLDDPLGNEVSTHLDGKTLSSPKWYPLVADAEDTQHPPMQGDFTNGIKAPNRIGPICHQVGGRLTNADTFSLTSGRDSQSRASPKAVYPLVIERILTLLDAFLVDFSMDQPIAPPSFSWVLSEGLELLSQALLLGLSQFWSIPCNGTKSTDKGKRFRQTNCSRRWP
jgi:hypothetical protein